jgi:hypothetical protein
MIRLPPFIHQVLVSRRWTALLRLIFKGHKSVPLYARGAVSKVTRRFSNKSARGDKLNRG